MIRVLLVLLVLLPAPLAAADGNRLTYLDEFCDPYYPHRAFPKLTTPQWVGDPEVEAVVVLAIDDMRDPAKYEAYLRPILERLKQIDGRAPVSIMTNQVDPRHEQLSKWLAEGVSLEVHTFDHPCPCLQGGDFAKAKGTYDRCVDLMRDIPGNRPVAFRMPCCDSLNTPSPRFWSAALHRTTARGNFLTIDSSVFNIITAGDRELPAAITRLDDGGERFRRYLPFPSFVNTIEDYPYPYVIGGLSWQFPCVVPSDWSAQHVQKPNNPDTVRDLKLALDACVIKQGVYNLVFHPHGWIRNDQIVELIDHAVATHGQKVKFLSFRECDERLRKFLLRGEGLRDAQGEDNGVRLLDANGDGYLDVVIGNARQQRTRIWDPRARRWLEGAFPDRFDARGPRFGVLLADGRASLVDNRGQVWHLAGADWVRDATWEKGLPWRPIAGYPSNQPQRDVGLRLRDLDGDGVCEVIYGDWRGEEARETIFRWQAADRQWHPLPFGLPAQVGMVHQGHDLGLRFVDLDGDGRDDLVYANPVRYGVYRFESMDKGWRVVVEGATRDGAPFPPIVRSSPDQDLFEHPTENNGAWFHSGRLWWQNEDTSRLPDHVDRRTFAQLLGQGEAAPMEPAAAPAAAESAPPVITPTDRQSARGQEATDERVREMGTARSPEEGLRSIAVPPGYRVELVAAEPLVVDPVAFDWGPDGRLWVVEMRDYPRGVDDRGAPGGRVKVLSDTNGDGRYDTAQIFWDDLPFPTGIKVWRKGVLITAAPEILYAEDTTGDGRADVRKTLYRGFGEGNEQHRVNGLRWGFDHWIYVGNGDSGGTIESMLLEDKVDIRGRDLRIRPDSGAMEAISGQTQFSLCFDDFGHRFGGNNSQPVWHYWLEDHHLRQNPHVTPPAVKGQIPVAPGNSPVFPRSRTVTRFNDYHTANRFTSACGIEIYRDDYLGGELYGNTFVCEPVHNLVHREVVEPRGVTFRSRRADSERESEFLASNDPWFRPVMARTGPDGALYIADMYRLVIEHPTWIPVDWQARLDLRAGADRGRIYRVVRDDAPPRSLARLDRATPEELVAELASPNGTRRDLAQQMLYWRGERDVAAKVRELARRHERPAVRVAALHSLAGLGALDRADLELALASDDPATLRQALGLAATHYAGDARLKPQLIAALKRDDPQVELAGALALAHWTGQDVGAALADLARHRAEDAVLWSAALLATNDREKLLGFDRQAARDPQFARRVRPALTRIAWGMRVTEFLVAQLVELADKTKEAPALDRMRQAVTLFEGARFDPFSFRPEDKVLDMLVELTAAARKLVQDQRAPVADRIVACRLLMAHDAWLLSERDHRRDFAFVAPLLRDDAPEELRSVAAELVRGSGSFPFAQLLHNQWIERTPSERRLLVDILSGQEQAHAALVQLLSGDRLLPSDLDAPRRQMLENHPQETVRAAARRLTHAVPLQLDDRAAVVRRYRDVLALAGDVTRGREAFRKRCTACHRHEDEGRVIGPDLASLTDRSPEALLVAILDPNRAVEAKYFEFLVITTGGQILSGIVTSETGTSITLASADGKEHTVLRGEIDILRSNRKSLMPDGLERDLTKQDLADVIAYLRATAAPPKQFPGNAPAMVKADADGVLQLSAAAARVYGPTLVFEAQHRNLGWWQSADDLAEWSVEVPAAGRYRVVLDFACAREAAGNTLRVAMGDQELRLTVPSTGTWDDYRAHELGVAELAAGEITVSASAHGAIRSALIDLRTIRLEPVK